MSENTSNGNAVHGDRHDDQTAGHAVHDGQNMDDESYIDPAHDALRRAPRPEHAGGLPVTQQAVEQSAEQPTTTAAEGGGGGSGGTSDRGPMGGDLNAPRRKRGRWVMPAAIALAAVAGGIWSAHHVLASHDAQAEAQRNATADQQQGGRNFGADNVGSTPAPVPPVSTAAATSAAGATAPVQVQPVETVHNQAQPGGVQPKSYLDAPMVDKEETGGAGSAASGDALEARISGVLNGARTAGAGVASAAGAMLGGAAQAGGGLSQALTPTATPRAVAGLLGNRDFILAAGAKIDCVGDTAFDSTEAGFSTCTVTKHVYSDNGHVLLIEKGAQIRTEYRATVGQGQRRVFVLSARVKTPNGVTVELDSPAADALGRMGLDGYVDNHWGERIGAALMLSLVQDSIGYLSTRGGNSSSSTVFANTEQTGNDMASKVLNSTINIAPTIEQNQANEFTIAVARDLDFGSVYALQPE